jgi:TolB protein
MRRTVLSLFSILFLVGCAQTRIITIKTRPPDANIKIDGVDRGKGPVTDKFVFEKADSKHTVLVSRLGFKDQTSILRRDFQGDKLNIDLRQQSKKVTINVSPVAANISIDGRPVSAEPTDSITQELDYTVDARNNWNTHTLTVDRNGFEKVERPINYLDRETTYNIRLEPRKKNLNITTNPPGAQLLLDGETLGVSPVTVQGRAFPIDLQSDEVIPQKLRVVKPGYDPIETTIGWEDGKTDYKVDLNAKTKTVRILTEPSGATVTIDGKALDRDKNGISTATLQFPPTNDKGDLKTYAAIVSKKTADSEWEAAQMTLAWDSGKPDYSITLKEIKTKPVTLLLADPERTDEGWEIVPKAISTLAMKDVTEGGHKEPPVQITRLPHGTQIDTLAVAPDGSRLLFTILYGNTKANFRSQMIAVHTDGAGGADYLSDGKSLEITPSYSPGGDQVVFSSNRAGRRMSVWSMSSSGAPGITQLTTGDTNDLWPTIDSDPKPRLFYQACVDTRPDPRIYMTALGTTTRTDMTQMSGSQPRVSPKADSVVFTAVNDKTGKRDIYLMPDRGGVPRNLTNTPDIDEFDPSWNKDGTRIAFVSDAGVDEERRQNLDIWSIELSKPERPIQVTTNGSWDDHPAWDPGGTQIYFRSNRGGEWAIWKVVAR